jgi:hypothetical protein
MDQGLTYQGSDTIDMQNKGTLVFHCYQILERWYVTDQTAILKLINFSALPEVLNISARIPFKQKLLLNVFFAKSQITTWTLAQEHVPRFRSILQ